MGILFEAFYYTAFRLVLMKNLSVWSPAYAAAPVGSCGLWNCCWCTGNEVGWWC